MKVIDSSIEVETNAFMITGNGIKDLKVMREIAKKYDHSTVIKIPKTPFGGEKGIDGTIKAIQVLMKHAVTSKYIVIIDQEHVKGVRNFEKKLTNYGFKVIISKDIEPKVWYFETQLGPYKAFIYVAISGCKKAPNIECNISKLIEILSREKVEPEKKAIKKWLREHGMNNYDEIIKKARKSLIEVAFPSHVSVLKLLIAPSEFKKYLNNPNFRTSQIKANINIRATGNTLIN